jgi:transcriptional regulator with XRE-family HTH domain
VSPRKLKTVLRELRAKRGWSQAKLATEAQVTGAYIAQIETGKKKNPSLGVLKRLARALGVPVTELLE